MPISGGVYTRSDGVRTGSTVNVAAQAAGAKCTAALADARENDLAGGINGSMFRDGSNAATGNMNLGSHKITAMADGTVATDAATKGQVDDLFSTWGFTLTLAADADAARAILTPFPSGTTMAFYQATAPVGWTKVTTYNNAASRIVSGTPSSGGTVDFTTAFTSQTPAGTVGGTAISSAQMPAHTHTATVTDPGHTHSYTVNTGTAGAIGSGGIVSHTGGTTGSSATGITVSNANTGGGETHTHSFTGTAINLAVKYVDCMLCTCDAPA
jgi:hypothetical protein